MKVKRTGYDAKKAAAKKQQNSLESGYAVATSNVITTNNTNYPSTHLPSPAYHGNQWSTKIDLPKPKVKTEEEKQEEILEIASTLENLIADFLPDSDKQVPVDIAKAVVEYLYNNNRPLLPDVDSQLFMQAESTVAQRIQNMTMEEYAKVRSELLGKHA